MSKKAAILLADGFEEAEALVPYDLLRRAEVSTDLVSVQNVDKVQSAREGVVVADLIPMNGYAFDVLDALILPGGYGAYTILKASPEVKAQAENIAADDTKTLGAICAGAALIGEWGLLRGRNYTCFPGLNGDFGGTFHQEHAVTDGNIVTGISAGGAFQFGFDLVTRLLGREKTDEIRHSSYWLTH